MMHEATFVEVNGARLGVCDVGSGHPIVFPHGSLSRWQHWEPRLAALPAHFRCVAFDQRGYGASSPAHGTSVTCMADDMAAVRAALGIAHACVVALSMGGFAGTGHWLSQEAADGFGHPSVRFIAAHPCKVRPGNVARRHW